MLGRKLILRVSFCVYYPKYSAAATVVDRVVASPHRRRCRPDAASMGVKGLLKELPSGNMKKKRVGFATLAALRDEARRHAVIDAGTLIFVCALRHKETHGNGDYVPTASEF